MARVKIGDKNRVPAMEKRLVSVRGARVQVGVLDNPGLAIIYAANELGTKNAGAQRNVTIPERSTLRATADSRKDGREAMADSSDLIDLNTPVLKSLDVIGLKFAEAVREKIRSNVPPPNKPSTIARKGSARTLIDKGQLVAAIAHKVV